MAAARDSSGRFVKLGLGASMTFDTSRAMPGMRQALGMINSMIASFPKLGGGAGKLAGALHAGSMAAAPLTAALAAGAGIATAFEAQMSAVNAVLMTDEAGMAKLEKKAKELGASTKFTAKEAAEGMEMLASAGFTTDQVIEGIGGTLALAAAGALDLGAASEITGNVINGMGLEAKDAGHVADVLAKVAADTSTDVRSVGVAFKYSAAQARGMGISLEENAYMLGAMADAGMKGSSGGTALQNMLSKLAKPTEKGAELFKKMGLEMTEMGADGKMHMKPLQGIVNTLNKELSKIEDPLKRAAMQEAVFGKIGQKGFSALAARGEKFNAMDQAEVDKRGVQSYGSGVVDGAAKKMADLRLVGVLGALEQLKSAGEGVVLEIFNKTLTAPMEQTIKDLTEGVSGVVQVMQALSEGADLDDLEAKFGPLIAGIGVGLRDAVIAVGDGIAWIKAKISELFSFTEGSTAEGIGQWVKYAAIFVVVVAAIVPVIAAMAAIGFIIFSVLIPAVTGLGALMLAAFWPVTIIGLAIVGIIGAISQENETLGQTVSRVWGVIGAWITSVWDNCLAPLWAGVMYGATIVWPMIERAAVKAVTAIWNIMSELFGLFSDFFPKTETGWFELGAVIVDVFGTSIGWVLDKVASALEIIWTFLKEVRGAFREIAGGNILTGLGKLGSALLDMVLEPVKAILRGAIQLADAVYVPVPDAVREFAMSGQQKLEIDRGKAMLGEDDLDKPKSMAPNSFYIPDAAPTSSTVAADQANLKGALNDLSAARAEGLATNADKQAKAIADAMKQDKEGCETNITSNLNLDGKKVAKNQAKLKNEMDDRAGFKSQPYQRRLMTEQGSAPSARGG